ncbi:MAG TPA: DUF559 domain-containing protein [Caulifigura sp.]|nr:DUF559 domain-containing protein [Caulifigura sp.]
MELSDGKQPELSQTEFARRLRRNPSYPERLLWAQLRNRRLACFKFARQVPIDSFVVDFACRERRLGVELDGDSHNDRGGYDSRRQRLIEGLGYRVVRFTNDDVLRELPLVLEAILRQLEAPSNDEAGGV